MNNIISPIIISSIIGIILVPKLLQRYLQFSRQRLIKTTQAIAEDPEKLSAFKAFEKESVQKGLASLELEELKRNYLRTSLKKVIYNWNVKQLKTFATEEFLNSTEFELLVKSFDSYQQKLGKLVTHHSEWVDDLRIVTRDENNLYFMRPVFEKGDAIIRVQIIEQEDSWRIHRFKVNYTFMDKALLGTFRPWNEF